MNTDTQNTITEADVVAWLSRRLIEAKRNNLPELGKIELGATHWSHQSLDELPTVRVYAWGADGHGCVSASDQPDIDSAIGKIAEQYANRSPAVMAAKKREEARALLAEADALWGDLREVNGGEK